MFKVGKNHAGKFVYEVSSLDTARIHAKEYSRSLSRWMDEKDCWVGIYDVNNVLIEARNFFRPNEVRHKL